jgi:hypothetical protein
LLRRATAVLGHAAHFKGDDFKVRGRAYEKVWRVVEYLDETAGGSQGFHDGILGLIFAGSASHPGTP